MRFEFTKKSEIMQFFLVTAQFLVFSLEQEVVILVL